MWFYLLKNFKAVQVLLVVICVHQSTPTEAGEVKINTIWTYNVKNNDTTVLPDFIQIDFKTESVKIRMNLIKQSSGSAKPPLIMTQFQGQRSIWKPVEFLGSYTDPSLPASATVAIKKGEEFEEIFYRITFTHNNKSFSLEPVGVDSPATEKDYKGDNVENKNKIFFKIDGRLHSLVETPATIANQNVRFDDDDHVKGRESRVRKRSVEKRLMTIETYVIIDYSTFVRFFKASKASSDKEKKEDARKAIFYMLTHIMEGVRRSYESIDSDGLKFTVKWIGALIAESAMDVPFFEGDRSKINPYTVDGDVALDELNLWTYKQNYESDEHKLPNYDTLVAFTSHYLEISEIGARGIADMYTICSTHSSSIVQYDEFFYAISATAHEIGHALGMDHDDEEDVDCTAGNNFVMASITLNNVVYNSFRFSNCSVLYLEETVKNLDKSNNNCLAEEGEHVASGQESEIFVNLFPGRIYDLDDQCKIIFGPKSFYCGGDKTNHYMCESISCFTGKVCKVEFMALDGTSCSTGSWCIRGKCVNDIRAPRAPKHCINGDYKLPRYNNSELLCKDEVDRDPKKCNEKNVKFDCCASCEGNRTKNGGCQDTTDECLSLEPKDCYNGYYAITCCKTCSALVQNPSDVNCLYGDKGVNCQDIIPAVCHLSTQYCCQTCAAYLSSVTKIVSSTITTATTIFSKKTKLVATTTTTSPPTTTTLPTTSGDFRLVVHCCKGLGVTQSYEGCKELVKNDPSLCYYVDVVKEACSVSCRSFEDYCINGDMDGESNKFTCEQLVEYNSSSCHQDQVRSRCCKACEDTLRKIHQRNIHHSIFISRKLIPRKIRLWEILFRNFHLCSHRN